MSSSAEIAPDQYGKGEVSNVSASPSSIVDNNDEPLAMQRLGLSHCSEGLTHPSEEPSSSHDIPQPSLNGTGADGPPSANSTSEEINDIARKIGYDDRIVISFRPGDPESPYNWSSRKKIFIVIVGILTVVNSTFGSSLPSGAISYMIPYFTVTNEAQFSLPIALYLVGYVLGPLFFAPLSETYGRKLIMVSSFILFALFTLACALAPTWPLFLAFRLLTGISASSAIAILGGLLADIYSDPVTRGRALAFLMAATNFGPQLSPIISGFVSAVSWRWPFWINLIFAGLALVLLLFTPETYEPTILLHRAQKMRKETGNLQIFAPIELEKKGVRQMVTVILMRPLRMLIFEATVLSTCLYLSLAYGIFYLFFVAYPLIFNGIYGMTPGVLGLAFLPIGIGAFIACGIFISYDIILQRAKKANAHWSSVEEYRRLPLACIGGPLYVISLFWLGWSANQHFHWIVPIMAGLPFGMGFMLIFVSLLNYLADAYEIFAASAMAASSCTRSLFGAALPFAGRPMYHKLGIAWASSLLGCFSLLMSIVPFIIIKYGDRIRANSAFCQELQKRKQERSEAKTQEDERSDGTSRIEQKGNEMREDVREVIDIV